MFTSTVLLLTTISTTPTDVVPLHQMPDSLWVKTIIDHIILWTLRVILCVGTTWFCGDSLIVKLITFYINSSAVDHNIDNTNWYCANSPYPNAIHTVRQINRSPSVSLFHQFMTQHYKHCNFILQKWSYSFYDVYAIVNHWLYLSSG